MFFLLGKDEICLLLMVSVSTSDPLQHFPKGRVFSECYMMCAHNWLGSITCVANVLKKLQCSSSTF